MSCQSLVRSTQTSERRGTLTGIMSMIVLNHHRAHTRTHMSVMQKDIDNDMDAWPCPNHASLGVPDEMGGPLMSTLLIPINRA